VGIRSFFSFFEGIDGSSYPGLVKDTGRAVGFYYVALRDEDGRTVRTIAHWGRYSWRGWTRKNYGYGWSFPRDTKVYPDSHFTAIGRRVHCPVDAFKEE
jgi:hypothetical protein